MSEKLPQTAQEIFDYVARKLMKQGKAAVNRRGRCVYRAPDGCKCAGGHLIPDDRYDPSMETKSVRGVPIFKQLYPDHFPLIADLQFAHDDSLRDCIDAWRSDMRKVASNYRLSAAVLDESVPA